MAYQVGRSKRINETLELVDNGGKVCESIVVDIDADAIAGTFRKHYTEVIDAERQLKEIQKTGEDMAEAYELYGNAVINVFQLVFGEANTQRILAFYENNYIEMCLQVVPFIMSVIFPKLETAIKERKKQAKNLYRR